MSSAGAGAGNGAGRPAPSDGVRWADGAIRIVEGGITSDGWCGSKPLPSGSPGTCAAGAALCVYQAGGV